VIPEPWEFALLALAAFRLWRLIGDDGVLDRPRNWLLAQIDARFDNRGDKLDYFITCPWCAGAWVSLGVYIGWLLTLGDLPDSTDDVFVGLGVWFAISAVVGYLGVTIDVLEDQKK